MRTAFAALTLSNFGLTSDSPSLFYAGDRHLFWLFHLGTPGALNFLLPDPPGFHSSFFRFPEQNDPLHYPVFPGFVAAVVSAIFSDKLGWMGPSTAISSAWRSCRPSIMYLFARYAMSLFGRTVGGSATLMMAFFPCILGHAINNAKDLPCTLLYGTVLMSGARGFVATLALGAGPVRFVGRGSAGLQAQRAVFALIAFVFWTPIGYLAWLRRERPSKAGSTTFLTVSYGLPAAALLLTDFAPTRPVLIVSALALAGPMLVDMLRGQSRVQLGARRRLRRHPLHRGRDLHRAVALGLGWRGARFPASADVLCGRDAPLQR